ncbi:MAG: PqqD family peptide modification chaperone [Undibacterium sp.]|uniref:PqqD family peptide modification chaperone n=1 Tax=Undibacterium sp. TaxID=1914977 RepID=UPI0027277EA3|nr:PqqD family peptide modification chaperone [Undibacterium sp.]MDO8653365.1 PqqD family peptide modification chaperone [Undibacterium sp.]
MNSNTSYVWSGDFCATNLDEHFVALVIENGKYYSFAKTGKSILQLLETPQSLEDLVVKLTSIYHVSQEKCLAETAEFLTILENSGLIKKTS